MSSRFHLLLTMVLLSVGGNLLSQSNVEDSLRNRLNFLNRQQKTFSRDTMRVDAMNDISYWYMEHGELEKALHFAGEAGVLAKHISYPHGLGDALNYKGHAYTSYGEFETARTYYLDAKKVFEALKDSSGMAHSWLNLANANYEAGNHRQSLLEFDEAMKLYLALKDRDGESDLYNFYGILQHSLGNFDTANFYFRKALVMKQTLGDKEAVCSSINNLGMVCQTRGDYRAALEYYDKSIALAKKINSNVELALGYNSLGIVHHHLGNFDVSLDYHYKSLELYESLSNKTQMGSSLNNIGVLYHELGSYEKAKEFYLRSAAIKEDLHDRPALADTWNNIGLIFNYEQKLDSALVYHEKALAIRTLLKDKQGMGDSYCNIGIVYYHRKQYDIANDYNILAMEIFEAMDDYYRSSVTCANAGLIYIESGQTERGRIFLEQALKGAKLIAAKPLLAEIYKGMMQADSANGDFRAAFENQKLYILYRDSLYNEVSEREMMQREMQYDFDKRAAQDSVANAKQSEIQKAKFDKQTAELQARRNQEYALFGGLALVVVFAGFMYNRFRVTNRQKKIIEVKELETREQKMLIEEKHKEITDSINYAERIQRSFLASKSELDKNLVDYFVFFRPKDVVSGDFYWATELKNGNFVYVTADSTGHGVPGAIMSILNIASLEKAVEANVSAATILNATRKLIIDRLKKDGTPEGGKDGMDCSLIVLSKDKKSLHYAAAHNPVWIVTANSLSEYVADKMPVGKHDREETPFAEHCVALSPGDVVYTATDGFADQFGGTKGKKFKYSRLKQLLFEIHQKPMSEQQAILRQTIDEWVGELEQVDDICIIGVRI